MEQLYKELKQFGKIKINEPLAKHTTCKIGGPADFFVSIESVDDIVRVLSILDANATPYIILGGGSNTLFSDDGFRGVVLHIADQTIRIENTMVIAAAGATTARVAHESVKHGLTGFEWGVGVPGTIGGAVRGNAGAMGKEMKDDVIAVDAIIDGELQTLQNSECDFSYRSSMFKKQGGVIIRVTLALQPSDSKDGMKKALETLQYRTVTQPKGYSSGCVFKNVDVTNKTAALLRLHFGEDNEKVNNFLSLGKISAGWLIEQAGMKGKICGHARVSDLHGNFIVNDGQAQAHDVLTLIEEIKERVYTTYGITLEEEVVVGA